MPVYTGKDGRHVVQFQFRGRRIHRRCPRGTTKAEAQALEAKLRHEIFATRDLGLEPTIDLPHAIATCLAETARGTTSDRPRELHAHALVDYVVGKTLHDIPDIAEAYRADAREAGLAIATVNARLNVLKKVAKWAWRQRLTRENVSAHVPLDDPRNERESYATLPQIKRLVRAMETDEGRAWVALAAGTGLRGGVLHGLQRAQAAAGYLHLPPRSGTKQRPRRLPVAAFAQRYLRVLPFTLTRNQLDQEWRRARAKVGLVGFRHHDLRHSYASLLVNEGVQLEVIGELLGHKVPRTTKRYAHLYDETLDEAVGRIR